MQTQLRLKLPDTGIYKLFWELTWCIETCFSSFIVTDHFTWVAPGELSIAVAILALERFCNLAFSTISVG